MAYNAEFTGWENVTLSDLVIAYRKAKADCYYEDNFPSSIKFAEYEDKLIQNLKDLLEALTSKKSLAKIDHLLGYIRVIPKKLNVHVNEESTGHVHFSDPDRSFSQSKNIEPEFRIVGDFPVEAHIISALWINMIGHKFDAVLEKSCYGARLKRIGGNENDELKVPKRFHITATTSFEPYFQPYQKWRHNGLAAIRNELTNNRKVIAASLDIKSYYHNIDPSTIFQKKFLNEIGLNGDKKLSNEEIFFTKQISNFLCEWSKKAQEFSKNLCSNSVEIPGGLVIGLTASRVISNVLLLKWDRLIRERLTPVHYGRYVDDMFLVLRDPETISNATELMNFIRERIGEKHLEQTSDSEWNIRQGTEFQGKSEIAIQENKQKLFVLQGTGGLDLLDSIQQEIGELSSEHRLMPSPDQLDESTAARVLSASATTAEKADTLRKADGLTIRRLSWALQLRHVETLARDLPRSEWVQQRHEFYEFAHNHVLRAENIFSHYKYLPRLAGFAASVNEWLHAEKIVRRSFHAVEQLKLTHKPKQKGRINGRECNLKKSIWKQLTGSMSWAFLDSFAKNFPIDQLINKKKPSKITNIRSLLIENLFTSIQNFDELIEIISSEKDLQDIAKLLAASDLATTPYKKILPTKYALDIIKVKNEAADKLILKWFQKSNILDTSELSSFLRKTKKRRLGHIRGPNRPSERKAPYILPTRPYTAAEVAELEPQCVGFNLPNERGAASVWAKYVRAIRGVWVKPTLLANQQDEELFANAKQLANKNYRISIGTNRKHSVLVAITNLKTDESSWAASASDRPELTKERYKSISQLVNQAIQLNPKPDYVIFPELSIPLKWVDSITSRLSAAGISLIAGTEYRHEPGKKIFSQACLHLVDNRLGFPASVRIWQDKMCAAVGEEHELARLPGKEWKYAYEKAMHTKKPVYRHNGFHFGVMVCSELQNSQQRIAFQGNVDAVFIISWNQDLDTFSALVEASALDIHAYTVLVNNRKYGDSRVRAPAKATYRRDLARLRGGENDYCVSVKLDVDELRAFQSRAKRTPCDGDPFKPVPEGFKLDPSRKRVPPK